MPRALLIEFFYRDVASILQAMVPRAEASVQGGLPEPVAQP